MFGNSTQNEQQQQQQGGNSNADSGIPNFDDESSWLFPINDNDFNNVKHHERLNSMFSCSELLKTFESEDSLTSVMTRTKRGNESLANDTFDASFYSFFTDTRKFSEMFQATECQPSNFDVMAFGTPLLKTKKTGVEDGNMMQAAEKRVFRGFSKNTKDDVVASFSSSSNHLNKPSTFLRAALNRFEGAASHRPTKKVKTEATMAPEKKQQVRISSLHLACMKPNVKPHEMDQLLRRYPLDVKKSETEINRGSLGKEEVVSAAKKELFTMPIHLAIKNGACSEVIEMLAKAAPSVLLMRDGAQRQAPLHLLMKHQRDNVSLVETFLHLNPRCAMVRDRHGNTAFHVACLQGAALEVVQAISRGDQYGWDRRNFHCQTPRELVQQRTATCSEELSQYLFH